MAKEVKPFLCSFAAICGRPVPAEPVPAYVDSQASPAGKFRPLGIPTVTDRVVQEAVKHLPGADLRRALLARLLWVSTRTRLPRRFGAYSHGQAAKGEGQRWPASAAPYQWVIEGDIKGCFDHIDHHLLMQCVRARIGDLKVTKLIRQFLKAGVLEEGFLLPTISGTPQGGKELNALG